MPSSGFCDAGSSSAEAMTRDMDGGACVPRAPASNVHPRAIQKIGSTRLARRRR